MGRCRSTQAESALSGESGELAESGEVAVPGRGAGAEAGESTLWLVTRAGAVAGESADSTAEAFGLSALSGESSTAAA